MSKISPVHPSEILQDEFLVPMELSQNRLALAVRVPARRINEIVYGKRRITADTALRLGKYFGVSPEIWMNLQVDYDIRRAKRGTWPAVEKRIRPIEAA